MEEGVVVRVELCCCNSSKSEMKTLSLSSFPTTFRTIKEKVEESCSVPACVQTVWYQSEEVPDNCNPASLYMRSGDLIRITFPQVGECLLVRTVVKWLKEVMFILGRCVAEDAKGIDAICRDFGGVLGNASASILATELFGPCTSKTKEVNCSHFMALGGIEHLVALHKLAIKLRDRTDCENAKSLSTYYEQICSEAIANLAMDKICRFQLICKGGGLDQSIASFLIKPADDDSLIFDESYKIVDMAVYAVCK